MTKRDIIILPDPKLRLVSEPVASVDDAVRQLADDAPGIGLAAIQIGVPTRMLVLDVAREGETPAPMVVINPEIVWESEERSVYQEGCLSIPEYYEDVERPQRIGLRFLDREGAQREIEADGLLATCPQHEIDHLNGKLFVDYLSSLKRNRIRKKLEKLHKQSA